MKLVRLLSAVTALSVVSLVVAACGSSNAPTATTAATKAPVATNTSAPTVAGATTAPTATRVPPTNTPAPAQAPPPTATAVPVSTGSIAVRVAQFGGIVLIPDQNGGLDGPLGTIYDPYVASNANAKLEPKRGFASSWESSADSTTWTFKTKNGVSFHDGTAATSKDLKYVFEFSMQTGSTSSKAGILNSSVTSLETPDDNTLAVKLKTPDILWVYTYSLAGAARRPAWLIPQKYVSTVGLAGVNKAPIGSGPFKFKEIQVDKLNVEAVPNHWFFGVPRTKSATFWAIPEESTALALMRAGEVDLSPITIANKKTAEAANLRTLVRKGQGAYTYFFREIFVDNYPGYGKNPFNSVAVRQALHQYGIDRQAIVDGFYPGIAEPSMDYPVLPQEVSWTGPLPLKGYNVATAKKMIADAGWPTGFEMDAIVFSATDDVAESVAVMWEKLGLKVNRVSMSEANFRAGMFASPGKSYFKKPTVIFSYTIATGAVASSFGLIAHSDPWASNLDPIGIQLAKDWAASPSTAEYKKRADAYRQWEYDNISSFSPVFLNGDILAAGAKIPKDWIPGADPSNLTRLDYALAQR